ncbi:PKD domain-containing protein [bacterium]|nr:PKD domain-containing protein [bacterium]
MKNNLTSFVLLLLCVFNVEAHNNNSNKKPVIDAYISILDAQHLTSVRVNIEKSDDPDGKITKTEINFGDGFVSSKDDVIHQYAADGVYTITIKAWDNRNAVSVVTKNIDVASNLILSDGASIYGPIGIKDNKTYSFNASASQLQKKFKLILTQQPENRYSMYLNKFLNWCYKFLGHNHNDKFEANVELNGIEIFAKNEISKNTLKAEKFVNLKNSNKIKADFDHEHGNKFKVEIKEVISLKDEVAPVITINVQSGSEVNTDHIPVSISDISGQVTTDVWKVMPLAQNGPPVSAGTVNQHILTTTASSFNIPLTEGLNSFILRSQDIFGNVSNYYYINNILYDGTAPEILSLTPQLAGTFYFYEIPPVQVTLPITKFFDIVASERIASLELISGASNLNLVFTDVARTKVSGRFTINQAGISVVQFKIKDYVGNERVYTYSINNIIVTEPIQVSLQPAPNQTYYTNQHFFNISYQMQANYPVYSKAFVNTHLQATTDGANASISVPLTQEGVNNIDMHFLYSFEPRFAAATGAWTIIKDSVAPSLSSSAPDNNTTVYTNHLPLTIPVSLQFSENLTNISVNGVSSPTFTNSYSTNHFVSSAGTSTLEILASDRAGNIGQLSHQINVQFSDASLVLKLSESSTDILTNKISIPLSGTASEKLRSIKMNNQLISIAGDGKSFDAVFEAPADGLYHIVFEGTDIYGNLATTDTYIRVLSGMPDGIENYKGPDGTYTNGQYEIDAGQLFGSGPGGDICNALDSFFGGTSDIELEDVSSVLGHLPKDYQKKIPKVPSLENFYKKHIDRDPANIVKAGYLMMCHGFELFASGDCQKNRELFKKVMRKYPEPFIIRKLPVPAIVQDFLIKRYNICSGLDTSGLGCKDLSIFVPFLADLALPGIGQMINSDMAEFVTDTFLCKELCDQPQYASTPLCQEFELPKIPNIPNFGAPRFSFPSGGSGGSWGRGGSWPGGGGGSCGGWFQPRCPGNGDSGGGAGGIGIDYICSAVPSLWLCHPDNPSNTGTITITPINECNLSWTINDIVSANPSMSLPMAFTNYVSSCLPSGLPFIPDNKKPILTVTAPVQNQVATENTVRVIGYVDDVTSQVKINGEVVNTLRGPNGLHFDVDVLVPTNLKILVEASDASGNLAEPIEVTLQNNTANLGAVSKISIGESHACVLIQNKIKCWGGNQGGQLGNGGALSTNTPTNVVSLPNGEITSFSAGRFATCAVVDEAVYCWGSGLPGVPRTNSAMLRSGLETGVKAVSVGNTMACALMLDGVVKCWNGPQPYIIAGLEGDEVDQLAVAEGVACVSSKNVGGVKCWGSFTPTRVVGSSPVQIPGIDEKILSLSVGFRFMCAVTVNNKLKCWGQQEDGSFSLIAQEMFSFNSIKKVSTSMASRNVCIQEQSGLKCWGPGELGQLGDGLNANSLEPVDVVSLNGYIDDFDVGAGFSCALIRGEVYCWGLNYQDKQKIEFKPIITVTSPVQNQQVSGSIQVTGYVDNVNAAVKVNGQQVITTPSAQGAYFSVNIVPPLDLKVKVEAVDEFGVSADIIEINLTNVAISINNSLIDLHNFGLVIIEGDVYTWENDATTLSRVSGIQNATAVTVGKKHTFFCAISDKKVYCWGQNNSAQIGIPTSQADFVANPTFVDLGGDVEQVKAGYGHVCALLSNKTVKCWGGGFGYGLGNGSIGSSSPSPVTVLNLDNTVTSIGSYGNSSCASLASGVVKCWGANYSGQLGDGTTIDRAAPVAVQGINVLGVVTNISGIEDERGSLGGACAQSNDQIKCWGSFDINGDGTLNSANPPIYPLNLLQPLVGNSFVAGAGNKCVIDATGIKCWGEDSRIFGPSQSSIVTVPTSVSYVNASNIKAIALKRSLCYLTNSNDVYCAGHNYSNGVPIKLNR